MTKKLLNKLPLQALSNGLIAVAVIYVAYLFSKGFNRMDKAAEVATKPIGNMLSDFTAWTNGNHRVEQTDLVIQPWYMVGNKISDQAWDVLSKDPGYEALLGKLFDGRTLKPEYRDLIGKPIGEL